VMDGTLASEGSTQPGLSSDPIAEETHWGTGLAAPERERAAQPVCSRRVIASGGEIAPKRHDWRTTDCSRQRSAGKSQNGTVITCRTLRREPIACASRGMQFLRWLFLLIAFVSGGRRRRIGSACLVR